MKRTFAHNYLPKASKTIADPKDALKSKLDIFIFRYCILALSDRINATIALIVFVDSDMHSSSESEL
jgi:hypothetical protein